MFFMFVRVYGTDLGWMSLSQGHNKVMKRSKVNLVHLFVHAIRTMKKLWILTQILAKIESNQQNVL